MNIQSVILTILLVVCITSACEIPSSQVEMVPSKLTGVDYISKNPICSFASATETTHYYYITTKSNIPLEHVLSISPKGFTLKGSGIYAVTASSYNKIENYTEEKEVLKNRTVYDITYEDKIVEHADPYVETILEKKVIPHEEKDYSWEETVWEEKNVSKIKYWNETVSVEKNTSRIETYTEIQYTNKTRTVPTNVYTRTGAKSEKVKEDGGKYLLEVKTSFGSQGSFNPELSACAELNETNGQYNLTTNISINDSTCFTITAPNVTLDCKGFTITGNGGTITTYGVLTTQYNTTIQNCNIHNFDASVFLAGTYGTVKDSYITTNYTSTGYGRALLLTGSSNLVVNTTVYGYKGGGAYSDGSTGNNNTIANSTAIGGNSTQAMRMESNNARIINVTVITQAQGINHQNGQNLTVDCQGATITGANGSGTYGVYSFRVNTTIRNCNISNFSTGIYINTDSADYADITNNTINTTFASACQDGNAPNCNAIFLNGADFATIQNNTLYAASNFTLGIYNSATDNSVLNNQIMGGGLFTVWVFTNSNSNTIANNNITTTGHGIRLHTVSGNTVMNNSVSSSVNNGVTLFSGTNNNITGNNVSVNSNGLLLQGSSNNNTFTNNTINATTGSGISIPSSGGSNNTFYLNNITSSSWVNNTDSTNLFNITGVGNIYYFANGTPSWQVYNITSSTAPNWADGGANRPFSGLLTQWSGAGDDWYPYTETSGTAGGEPLDCGNLSTPNTIYNMSYDLYSYSATCFTITAPNVTLDCKGFTILGSNSSATYGVFSNQANTVIKNCKIDNFDGGIYINSGANSTIQNNTVYTTINNYVTPTWASSIAIVGGAATNTTIVDNNVSSLIGQGLWMTSSNNTVSNLNANASTRHAVAMSTSSYNVFTNISGAVVGSVLDINSASSFNVFNNTTSVFSNRVFLIQAASNNNTIFGMKGGGVFGKAVEITGGNNNTIDCLGDTIVGVNNSGSVGISTVGSNTIIRNCNISNFSTGISLASDAAVYATVANNTINMTYRTSCSQSTGVCSGIFVYQADYASILDNTISAYDGAIVLYSNAYFANVRRNRINAINAYGLYALGTQVNNYEDNNITSLSYAILVYSVTGHNYTNNTVTSTGTCYAARGSTSIRLINNSFACSYRATYFYSDANSRYTILNNTFYASSVSAPGGLYFDDAAHTNFTIADNTISAFSSNAVNYGIFMATNSSNISYMTVENNTIIARATGGSTSHPVYLGNGYSNTFRNNTIISNASTVAAIKLEYRTSQNRFYENNITGTLWVNNNNETNIFNTTGIGNIYYFQNGTPSWQVYEIYDTEGDNWADFGPNIPINSSLSQWSGSGADWHPYSNIGAIKLLWVNQTPIDITTTNVVSTPVRIQYNITAYTNVSFDNTTARLCYKTNNSVNDISAYINGTAISGFVCDVNGRNLTANLFNFSLYDNEVYPYTENIADEQFRTTAHTTLNLTSANDYHSIQLMNVSSSIPYSYFELMFNSTTATPVRVYTCNSSYTTGNVETSPNCAQFASVIANGNYDHYHPSNGYNYSAHRVLPYAINASGFIETVKVSSNMTFLVRGNNGATVVLWGLNTSARTDAEKTSSTNGNTWTNVNFSSDTHLHQFYENTTLYYYACINSTVNRTYCSFGADNRTETLAFGDIPPTPPFVYSINSTQTYYNDTSIWINYTPAVSPTNNSIVGYNITLNYDNGTYIKTIANNNYPNLTYLWLTNGTAAGINYIITVEAIDNLSNRANGTSPVFKLTDRRYSNITQIEVNWTGANNQYTNLSCLVTAESIYDTNINVSLSWFKNGVNQSALYSTYNVVNATPTLLGNLSGLFAKGENWSCAALGRTTTNTSALNFSTNLTIGNVPLENASFGSSFNYSTTHRFNFSAYADDADGGADITNWRYSSTLGTCTNITSSVSGNRRTVWMYCESDTMGQTELNITFVDASAEENSTIANFTYVDHNASLTAPMILPQTNNTGVDLTCDVGNFSDIDGDIENVSARTFRWFVNGAFINVTDQIAQAGNFTQNDFVICEQTSIAQNWTTSNFTINSTTVRINNQTIDFSIVYPSNASTFSQCTYMLTINATFSASATNTRGTCNLYYNGTFIDTLTQNLPQNGLTNFTFYNLTENGNYSAVCAVADQYTQTPSETVYSVFYQMNACYNQVNNSTPTSMAIVFIGLAFLGVTLMSVGIYIMVYIRGNQNANTEQRKVRV